MDESINSVNSEEERKNELVTVGNMNILITEADKYGSDLAQMSNFYVTAIKDLTLDLAIQNELQIIDSFPVDEIGVIQSVVQRLDAVTTDKYTLLPDFDHLPKDIKQKLDEGIYTIGESKQVDGNLRPVILDEEGVRVKDITLKEVKNPDKSAETTQNLMQQIQMKQISDKLDSIAELQGYQIDQARNAAIKVPFLNARDYILKAQETEMEDKRKEYLELASKELITAKNALRADIDTATKRLEKGTRRSLFRLTPVLNNYVGYIAEDFQLSSMYTGVHLLVMHHLGDVTGAKQVIGEYSHMLDDFFNKKINGITTPAMLMHNNYPYNEKNNNSWYNVSKEYSVYIQNQIENKNIILISVEDVKDEQ